MTEPIRIPITLNAASMVLGEDPADDHVDLHIGPGVLASLPLTLDPERRAEILSLVVPNPGPPG